MVEDEDWFEAFEEEELKQYLVLGGEEFLKMKYWVPSGDIRHLLEMKMKKGVLSVEDGAYLWLKRKNEGQQRKLYSVTQEEYSVSLQQGILKGGVFGSRNGIKFPFSLHDWCIRFQPWSGAFGDLRKEFVGEVEFIHGDAFGALEEETKKFEAGGLGDVRLGIEGLVVLGGSISREVCPLERRLIDGRISGVNGSLKKCGGIAGPSFEA
ncbi:hypothetical protein V8G54_004591 [Vigna mungo]|uniref:Uncharacterized protein n=1 Tax=Vigna mungo TaxID=3915 RepID=A0AAQ3PH25_VIGMU